MGEVSLLTASLILLLQCIASEGSPISFGNTLSNCKKTITSAYCFSHSSTPTFQTIDGTCNNLRRPTQGAANTPHPRLAPADYVDAGNLDTPRGFPGTTPTVPTAHEVAGAVFQVHERNRQRARGLSVMFMAFGQLLDHDMGYSLHPTCDVSAGCGSSTAFTYPCFPIQFERNGKSCTSFARTFPVCQSYQTRTTREQLNTVSSYLDLSHVYGNELSLHRSLRRLDGTGLMKVTTSNQLPIKTPESDPSCNTRGGCSLVGDGRGDENIALHTMHTIFLRNHNYIAAQLRTRARISGEQLLFETARKINIAIWQRIVYEEFLPKLVNLRSYQGYQAQVDASITNVFATASFRFGHSLVPNAWSQLNNNFDKAFADISLQASFMDTRSIRRRGIEPTVFGLLANESQEVDTKFAFGIARRLFVPVGEIRHEDLTALNIQRGRDHGLQTYGGWRRVCNLPALNGFASLKGVMPDEVITGLRKVYSNPNDIDIFAAGIAEIHTNGKMLGPTFQCIQKIQFEKLRDGDRFYYENQGIFSFAEKREIQKMTFAKVLCNTLKGIVSIQPRVFDAVTSSTVRRECGGIADINFSTWSFNKYYY